MIWEYFTTDRFLTGAYLNRLGAEGWELVTVERDNNNSLTAYLKRQTPAPQRKAGNP